MLTPAIYYNHVDKIFCRKRGIRVSRVPDFTCTHVNPISRRCLPQPRYNISVRRRTGVPNPIPFWAVRDRFRAFFLGVVVFNRFTISLEWETACCAGSNVLPPTPLQVSGHISARVYARATLRTKTVPVVSSGWIVDRHTINVYGYAAQTSHTRSGGCLRGDVQLVVYATSY